MHIPCATKWQEEDLSVPDVLLIPTERVWLLKGTPKF